MKIAGYGPPGLLASALAELCQDKVVGSTFGSNEPLSAEALFAADAVILWIPAASVPLQTVDRIHDILVMLREIRRRLVFVSLIGGDSPLEREAALLDAVFVDCGVVYENGCAEALMPLYREIWYGTKRPVPVPASTIVVVRASELAVTILEAAAAEEPPTGRLLAFEASPVDLRCLATRLMRQLDIEGGLETDESMLVRDLTPADAVEWATLTSDCGALSRSVDTAGVLPASFSDVSFDDFRRDIKRVVAVGPESDYLAKALADMLGLEIPAPATSDDGGATSYGALVSRIFSEHMPEDKEERQWQAQRLGLLRPGVWRRGFVTSARTSRQLRTIFASPKEHEDNVLVALRPTHVVALLTSNDDKDWISDDWSLSSSTHTKAPSSLHESHLFGADIIILNDVDELSIYFGRNTTPTSAPVPLEHHEQEDGDEMDCKPPPFLAPQPPHEAAVPRTTPGAFDHISKAEYDELYDHSTEARNYLLSNVMRPLASAMLEVVRLPPAVDKVAALADKLAVEADHAEARAEAVAYLRFRSSLARLRDLRAIEAEEDFREEAAALARQQAARDRVRRKLGR